MQTLDLTVILSVPDHLRIIQHDMFLAHVRAPYVNIGDSPAKQLKTARAWAVRVAQETAAEEYGLTINEAGRFNPLYVIKGHHRDIAD